MSAMTVAALLFALLGLACVGLTAVSLPGGLALLALALVMELADPLWLDAGVTTFGWGWIGGAVALVAIGEGVEFLSGVLGVKAGGGTRRGMWGAMAGGLVGAIAFTVLLPIPVLGTLVGALVGTFVGAMAAEMSGEQARSAQDSLVPALGATVARVAGMVAKVGLTTTAWLVLVVAAFTP